MSELQRISFQLNRIHITFQWSQPCTPFLSFTSPATVTSTPSNKTPQPTNPPQSSTSLPLTNPPQPSPSPSTSVKSDLQSTEGEKEVNNSKLLQPS